MSYHLTPAGKIAPCGAQKGRCPYGEYHYPDPQAAQGFFENLMLQAQVRLTVPLSFTKGYLGLHFPREQLAGLQELFKFKVREPERTMAQERQLLRDGEEDYHVTVVNYKEFKELKKAGVRFPQPSLDFTVVGVGKVEDKNGSAFFGVVDSPAIQNYRKNLGLPPSTPHVTLGFTGPKDIFTLPKDRGTLL